MVSTMSLIKCVRTICIFSSWLSPVLSHMQMSKPIPLRSPLGQGSLKDYDMTDPLEADGSDFTCKGYQWNTPLVATETYTAGQTYTMTVAGSANHGGGSCQMSLSYDNGTTFKVIKSIIGGCPLQDSYDFTIPQDAPAGQALLAWTWMNKIGNREYYMNCAVVNVTNSGSSKRDSSDALADLPDIFVANLANINDCKTIEGIDTVFPNPGTDVSYGNGGSKRDNTGQTFKGTNCVGQGRQASSGNTFESPASSSQSTSSDSTGTSSTVLFADLIESSMPDDGGMIPITANGIFDSPKETLTSSEDQSSSTSSSVKSAFPTHINNQMRPLALNLATESTSSSEHAASELRDVDVNEVNGGPALASFIDLAPDPASGSASGPTSSAQPTAPSSTLGDSSSMSSASSINDDSAPSATSPSPQASSWTMPTTQSTCIELPPLTVTVFPTCSHVSACAGCNFPSRCMKVHPCVTTCTSLPYSSQLPPVVTSWVTVKECEVDTSSQCTMSHTSGWEGPSDTVAGPTTPLGGAPTSTPPPNSPPPSGPPPDQSPPPDDSASSNPPPDSGSQPPYVTGDPNACLPCHPGSFLCKSSTQFYTCSQNGGDPEWTWANLRDVAAGMMCQPQLVAGSPQKRDGDVPTVEISGEDFYTMGRGPELLKGEQVQQRPGIGMLRTLKGLFRRQSDCPPSGYYRDDQYVRST